MASTPLSARQENFNVFDKDALTHGGYLYTASKRLSCRMATQRSTEAILAADCFRGRSIIDLGCGDGFYSIRWWDQGKPKALVGIDPAAQAIAVANTNKQTRPITFETGDAHHLKYADDSFDVALIQSILHHDDDPRDIIREAFRVAPVILIHEPNGNNPGLKLIEKLSGYHREHNEKSYSSHQLAKWVRECGGKVTYKKFAGFVPMFSPDWLARTMKLLEPIIERLPFIKSWACSVTVLAAHRQAPGRG